MAKKGIKRKTRAKRGIIETKIMDKIVLYEQERPDIKISMEMYFNEENQLIFDGYDIGKTVSDCWGDSDYEYTYKIQPDEVEKLFRLFEVPNSDRSLLLLEIKKRFGVNEAYSMFGDFMEKNNIKYSSATWA